jgi:hypothetical protein
MSVLYSCSSKPSEPYVAKVKHEYLMQTELDAFLRNQEPPFDSATVAETYINSWINQRLMLDYAKNNLSDEGLNIKEQLKSYEESLLIYNYEKEIIRQKLDGTVSDEEIKAYYDTHKEQFILKNNLVRVSYIKLPVTFANKDQAKEWLKNDEKFRNELEELAQTKADNYYLDNGKWILVDDLFREIPLEVEDQEAFIKKNNYFEVKEDEFIYLVIIKSYLPKNSLSPLSVEEGTLKNMLLNKKKVELLQQMQKDIYNQALKENDIELVKPN